MHEVGHNIAIVGVPLVVHSACDRTYITETCSHVLLCQHWKVHGCRYSADLMLRNNYLRGDWKSKDTEEYKNIYIPQNYPVALSPRANYTD
jgi:hypothetical protein